MSAYQRHIHNQGVTNVPWKGQQTVVQQSCSQTSMDAMLTHKEPSLAQWAIADMYEEAHDPIWQMHTPPPLIQESGDEDDGIEAEWVQEQ